MDAPLLSLIENFVTGFDESVAKAVTKRLIDKEVSLIDLVEQLGCFLTNKETNTRARATRLLSDVLHILPQDWLSQQQVSLLSTYLCEKLADHHSLQPHAIYGLLALSKSGNLSGECLETVCRTVFKEVHTQSLAQADRRSVFNFLYILLTTRLKDVQRLGADFVYGFIQAMDSEKDPRNLIIAFSCAQVIIENFSLGVFVEEMFEVVSCYFPIDFSPSASDPSGIKKEDLIIGLRQCLAATPQFAEHCLPLIMEKLTSDMKSAKIDSLDTLTMCAKVYGAGNLTEFQSSIFQCIKKEIFLSGGDLAVEEAALKALQAIVAAIATGVSQADKRKSLDGFVDEILTECKNHLLQPELMLMLSTGRILQSAALGSQLACSQIVKTSMPLLIEAYNKQTQDTPKHNVIHVLNGFLGVTSTFTYTDKYPNPIMSTYKSHLLDIYNKSLDEESVSIQLLAMQGVHTMVQGDDLTQQEVADIAGKLVNKILQVACEPDVRNEVKEVLRSILHRFPTTASTDVYPTIFNQLHNEPMEIAGSETIDRAGLLDVLSSITRGANNLHLVTDKLYKILSTEYELAMYRPLTRCLSSLAEHCSVDRDCTDTLCTGVTILHDVLTSKCRCIHWYNTLTDIQVMCNLAAFIRYQACHWHSSKSEEMQSKFMTSFLKCDDTIYQGDSEEVFKGQPAVFSPLKACCDSVFVSLLTPVVCSASTQCTVPQLPNLLARLSDLVCQPMDTAAHTHVCKCLAGIINRQPADESLDGCLTSLKGRLVAMEQGHTVMAFSWVAKALVLRGHSMAKQFVDILLSLLADGKRGREAAQGFRVILTDHQDVMTRDMHANVRLMYKQRFFIENLSAIVTGYEAAGKETKQNYLSVLSYLLHGLDKQVLIAELPRIYPLLIQLLLCDDIDLQLVTMETLSQLICSAPNVVDKQIDSLIPQLLRMSTYKLSMKVRIAALKCLEELVALPVHVLVPYRQTVTRTLVSALDDKKRLVRAQAVNTRQEWILLETPKSS